MYGLIAEGLLGVKPEVAAHARMGLIILIPWSAFIGWRRYLQGILIRYDHTREIGMGTAARALTLTTIAVLLYFTTHLPSIVVAATAIIISVGTEASIIHWLSRDVILRHLSRDGDSTSEPLTMKKLRAFHFPLTATTMVSLLIMPLVSAGIARGPSGFGAGGLRSRFCDPVLAPSGHLLPPGGRNHPLQG